jgi:hypothetical protein
MTNVQKGWQMINTVTKLLKAVRALEIIAGSAVRKPPDYRSAVAQLTLLEALADSTARELKAPADDAIHFCGGM